MLRTSCWRPRKSATVIVRILWVLLAVVPVGLAAFSPLLAYRNLPYTVGGFAGIAALSVMLLQPALIVGWLHDKDRTARRLHKWVGISLLALTLLHVGGLYVTSPADTLDALTLASPTPFSIYGVAALAGVLCLSISPMFRQRLRRKLHIWRRAHSVLAVAVAVSTAIHAVQIQGAMENISKILLCVAVVTAAAWVMAQQFRR